MRNVQILILDLQGRWEEWKTCFLVFQAFHGPSFPQSVLSDYQKPICKELSVGGVKCHEKVGPRGVKCRVPGGKAPWKRVRSSS